MNRTKTFVLLTAWALMCLFIAPTQAGSYQTYIAHFKDHHFNCPPIVPRKVCYQHIKRHDEWVLKYAKKFHFSWQIVNHHTRELAHAKAHLKKIAAKKAAASQMLWCRRGECIKTLIRRIWVEDPNGAIQVASCESGFHADPVEGLSMTGQYVGVFQLGTSERASWGRGIGTEIYRSSDPSTAIKAPAWEQITAGHELFKDLGWSPWQCSPYGGLNW